MTTAGPAGRAAIGPAEPCSVIGRLLGALTRVPVPARLLDLATGLYARATGARLDEAVRPDGGWRTFGRFFTRALAPSSRPFPADSVGLACPVDGRLVAAGAVTADAALEAKGLRARPAVLLGRDEWASEVDGGRQATWYLAPGDYHRVHTPCPGVVTDVLRIPGSLFPVRPPWPDRRSDLFASNERAVCRLVSEAGPVLFVILVGARNVGSIRLPWEKGRPPRPRSPLATTPGVRLETGAELGRFELGSTVIVLVPASARLDPEEPGARWKCGEPAGTLAP